MTKICCAHDSAVLLESLTNWSPLIFTSLIIRTGQYEGKHCGMRENCLSIDIFLYCFYLNCCKAGALSWVPAVLCFFCSWFMLYISDTCSWVTANTHWRVIQTTFVFAVWSYFGANQKIGNKTFVQMNSCDRLKPDTKLCYHQQKNRDRQCRARKKMQAIRKASNESKNKSQINGKESFQRCTPHDKKSGFGPESFNTTEHPKQYFFSRWEHWFSDLAVVIKP